MIDRASLPLAVPLQPHLQDHRAEGRAVLPGVEALALLAGAARRFRPDTDVTRMSAVSFDRFLPLDPAAPLLSAAAELSLSADGAVRAVLVTQASAKTARMTRQLAHAAVTFGGPEAAVPELPLDLAAAVEGPGLALHRPHIYPELVGFGPAFRTLETVFVAADGAVGRMTSPVERPADADAADLLGSGFALDAALHAACIWGQRAHGIVAFPVGVERRRVHRPVGPGEGCVVHVRPVPGPPGALGFELRLYDVHGELREACAGVRMRDVSGGRLTPPDWIRGGGEPPPSRVAARCRALSVIELAALAPFAERALSPAEQSRVAPMRGRRRTSFVAARLACKRLSRRLSGDDRHTPPQSIDTLEPGRPERPACPPTDGRTGYACSVSHDRRFAVAAAGDGPVGIDVEALSDRVLRSRSLYLHPAEERLVQAFPLGPAAAALRIWSLKEAVAKALDLPLAEAWRRVETTAVGAAESRLTIDGRELSAVHDEVGGHVFTVVGAQSCDRSDRTDATD